MSKIHELRQQLGKAVDELELMAGKSEADGFKQDVYDALKDGTIPELQKRIKQLEDAQSIAAQPGHARSGPGPHDPLGATQRAQGLQLPEALQGPRNRGREEHAPSTRPTPPACGSRPRSSATPKPLTGASRAASPVHQGPGRRRRLRRWLPRPRGTAGEHHRASRAVRRVPPGMPGHADGLRHPQLAAPRRRPDGLVHRRELGHHRVAGVVGQRSTSPPRSSAR
jgi:hypothetical protein